MNTKKSNEKYLPAVLYLACTIPILIIAKQVLLRSFSSRMKEKAEQGKVIEKLNILN
jgi:hypothetical protein